MEHLKRKPDDRLVKCVVDTTHEEKGLLLDHEIFGLKPKQLRKPSLRREKSMKL
jgi:hypothetical protein